MDHYSTHFSVQQGDSTILGLQMSVVYLEQIRSFTPLTDPEKRHTTETRWSYRDEHQLQLASNQQSNTNQVKLFRFPFLNFWAA